MAAGIRVTHSAQGAPGRTEARAGESYSLGLRLPAAAGPRPGRRLPVATSPRTPLPSPSLQASALRTPQTLLARSPQHDLPLFKIQVLTPDDARLGFRLDAEFDLVIEPNSAGGFEYRYDPARPESVLAKAEVNDALQAAAGRKDTLTSTAVTSSEPSSRYITTS